MPERKQDRVGREQKRSGITYIDSTDADSDDYVFLGVNDTVVRCLASADDYTLFLPSVALAMGKFYAIHATIANSKTVLVLHLASDSDDWDGSTGYDLDADNDGILLYSDGIRWWDCSNQVS